MARGILSAAIVLALFAAAGGGVSGGIAGAMGRAPAPSDSSIFVPPESDGPLLQPPEIRSQNGMLKADVAIIRAGIPGSGKPVLYGGLPTYTQAPMPSPTPPPSPPQPPIGIAHAPLNFAAGYQFTTATGTTYPAQFPAPTLRIEPGNTLDLTVRNQLAEQGPPLPAGADLTNLHTHGLVVGALGDEDNVYRPMSEGGTYRTRITFPATTQSGYDWYHAHHHGFVADQVYGGLAGSLQVGDPLDPWPQYKGKYEERVLDLTGALVNVDQNGLRFLDDVSPQDNDGNLLPYGRLDTWRKYVNGQFNPTISIRPGETQIWNFTSMTRNAPFNLGLTDKNGEHPWAATIFAYDGNERNLVPNPITLGLAPFVYNGPTVLDPGARITMAVTAPKQPGTYYLVDDMTMKLKPQSKWFALATIKVEGEPATEPVPVFTPTGSVPDLYTATPDQRRTFVFSSDTSGPVIKFAINGSFFPDTPLLPLQVGQVEEWLLVNTSPVDHTFHIHQTDFAVISVNTNPILYVFPITDATPYRYVSLRDSVNIPPGGSVVVRFRVSPELGKYVFHCHILAHEDFGMMMAVLAVPNQTQRRIALGPRPGQSSAVLVQDGAGRPVGRIALGRTRAGVATTTGDLNGDLTEDVVVARPARAGARASVAIYDGTNLQRITSFRPFPQSPRAALSVAVGDIDRDGTADIVVGRASAGPSLVRIFRPDGTLVRELTGTLGGRLPGGVSVASADFNGDNYDDVAIGAGRGSTPRVVGLDGYSLGGSGQPQTLFAFQAGGGRTAGAGLAAGYYDPRTRPGFDANLITTPLRGPSAGTVQVWTPMSVEHASMEAVAEPHLMLTLKPLRRHVAGGLRLAITRLGSEGLDALAAWADPRRPVYLTVDEGGAVARLQTPVGAGAAARAAAVKVASAQVAVGPGPVAKVIQRRGYRVVLRLAPNRIGASNRASVTLTSNGRAVRGATVTARVEMLDMEMGQRTFALHETGRGVYAGSTSALLMPGRWGISFRIKPPAGQRVELQVVDTVAG